MSRLTDLLRQARQADPQLGADLEAEVAQLMKRRQFGLVFERHQPEAVELPGRPIRRGDKVRVLPPRGEATRADQRLWRVEAIHRSNGQSAADLLEIDTDEPQRQTVATTDLVNVAEFRDRIYPGLIETGRIERADLDRPFHTVINAENYHALELLTYTHRGAIDCIYIDPPYNSGARDWKYNNDYVEADDDYRHSKWLAFMERRLKIARELLNDNCSTLIVTIDEKEHLRLGLLLEQVFPDARVQMLSIVTNPNGSSRKGEFTRVNEFAFFCFLGVAQPLPVAGQLRGAPAGTDREEVRWERLMKGSNNARREDRPNLFYPVFVDPQTRKICGVGRSLPLSVDRSAISAPAGLVTVWPLSRDGAEKRWQMSPETLTGLIARGLARVGSYDKKNDQYSISYLNRGQIERWDRGDYVEVGRDDNGVVQLEVATTPGRYAPTVWDVQAHNAGEYGSRLLRALIPGAKFPFPKSLHAVEDCLRMVLAENKSATVLDFFAGSGTTAHAVMRLNAEDGGHRQCISITNNEVSADEQRALRLKGFRPGDPEWEAMGICDQITKPRLTAAVTGTTAQGRRVTGEYRFGQTFPLAQGLTANAAYFTLTYEAPLSVRHHRAFERIAPLLWMRAGSRGRTITSLEPHGWGIADTYAVLENLDQVAAFTDAVAAAATVHTVFVITDDESAFQMVCRDLSDHVSTVRLYESYLQNFQIMGGAR